jgi:hypothetical protein
VGLWQTNAVPVTHAALLTVYGEGAAGVAYTPKSTGVVELIDGIFDAAAVLLTTDGNGAQIQTRAPQLSIRVADLTVTPKGGDDADLVTIRGVVFRVIRVEPDGDGWAVLTLVDQS